MKRVVQFFAMGLYLFAVNSTLFAAKVNIEGLDRAKIIQALYQRAKIAAASFIDEAEIPDLSENEAEMLVGRRIQFLIGKVMKINVPGEFTSNEIDTEDFNRANGTDAAEQIIEELRSSGRAQSEMSGEIVYLKNGGSLPKGLAVASLKRLMALNLREIQALRILARNPTMKTNPSAKLESVGILDGTTGQLTQHMRDLLLAATEDLPGGFKIVDPFVSKPIPFRCSDLFGL